MLGILRTSQAVSAPYHFSGWDGEAVPASAGIPYRGRAAIRWAGSSHTHQK